MTGVNIIDPKFQWNKWAMPKCKGGKLDHHKAMTSDDLKDLLTMKSFHTSKNIRPLSKVQIP